MSLTPPSTRRLAAAVAAVAALMTVAVPVQAGLPGGPLPFVSENVEVVASIPMPGAVGARFDGNVLYVTGSEGLRTFDVSDPALPVPLGFLPLPHFENEDVSFGGDTLLISADHYVVGSRSVVYVIDIADPRSPTLRTVYQPRYADGRGVDGHTASCVAPDCRYAYLAGGSGLGVLDTQTGEVLGRVARDVGGTHDVQFDSAGNAWVAGSKGTAGYDTSDPTNPKLVAKTDFRGDQSPWNDFIHHNSLRPDTVVNGQAVPGDVVFITEEDYLQPSCKDPGSFQAWKISGALDPANPAVLLPLDLWTVKDGQLPPGEETAWSSIMCSAHYFDIRDGLAANASYEQGTRFLDVSDPGNIHQVGYFVPRGPAETWAAYFAPNDPTGTIVYVVDAGHGIDVLRIDRSNPVTTPAPAEAGGTPADLGQVSVADDQFGWACRILA